MKNIIRTMLETTLVEYAILLTIVLILWAGAWWNQKIDVQNHKASVVVARAIVTDQQRADADFDAMDASDSAH